MNVKAWTKVNKSLLTLTFLAILISGCSTAPEVIKLNQSKNYDPEIHCVYILSHGWHTGITVYAEDLNRKIGDLSKRFPKAIYYEIGWGDADFYQAEEVTTKLTLQAMFASTGTVVHVAGLKNSPEEFFSGSEMIRINLDRNDYEGMLEFIKSSFFIDKSGYPVRLKTGVYGDSQFYQGSGRYHAFNTCNTWTAKALASAGLDINFTLKLTSSSVMGYLEEKTQPE